MKSKQIDFVKEKSEKGKSEEEKKGVDREISVPEEKRLSKVISSSISEKPEVRGGKDKLIEVKTPGITEMSMSREDLDFEEPSGRNLEDVVGANAASSDTSPDLSTAEKEETNNLKIYNPEKKELPGSYGSQRSQSEKSEGASYTPQTSRSKESERGLYSSARVASEEVTTEPGRETNITDDFIKDMIKYRPKSD